MGVSVIVAVAVCVTVAVAVGDGVSVALVVGDGVWVTVTSSAQTVSGLDRFCGSLGLIRVKSTRLLSVSMQLPKVPPGLRS